MEGGKRRRKSSKKGSKKKSKKVSKKKSKKRRGQPWMTIQANLIKEIAKKEDINFPQAMKKLKSYIAKALGHPYEKGGNISYEDALKKTMVYIKK